MKEKFLHFLWKYQYFNSADLTTEGHLPVVILQQGSHNHDAGPDFRDAAILIDGIRWLGDVEIHINSSDWVNHKHYEDRAYNAVVLHVVWNDDQIVYREDGSVLPVIQLQGRVQRKILDTYQDLSLTVLHVPCAPFRKRLDREDYIRVAKIAYDEKSEIRSIEILARMKENCGNRDDTTYQLLLRHFGMFINRPAFEALSNRVPFTLLFRHRDNLFQLEALLFGMGGFLDRNPVDDYQRKLSVEYSFLKHKYSLGTSIGLHEWKFLRLRPANFPTVRLAQLASCITHNGQLFSAIKDIRTWKEAEKVFYCDVSSYWKTHYYFGKCRTRPGGIIGKAFLQTLMINVIIPIQKVFQDLADTESMDQALLRQIIPENNRIIRMWKELSINPKNALESQGLIALFNQHCTARKCLDCGIVHELIKNE